MNGIVFVINFIKDIVIDQPFQQIIYSHFRNNPDDIKQMFILNKIVTNYNNTSASDG